MTVCRYLFAGAALAALTAFSPAAQAQESGSMQVGNTTVSVGGGTAILTLPDVPSLVARHLSAAPFSQVEDFEFSDDFGDEIGWNVNGSIAVPAGANKTLSLNGFWANIDDKDSATCITSAGENCRLFPLFDPDPAVVNSSGTNNLAGNTIVSNAERDVDQWGVSLETLWNLTPGVMGVTRAPHRRSFALGADIRGIDQDLDVSFSSNNVGIGPATYTEDLDTRYYGAYAAWGGDYNLPFLSGVTNGLGLRSSFLLRGGIYYADTDYSGRIIDNSNTQGNPASGALSLSRNDTAFIGGLVLETRKRIGARAMLSLKSEYEYYSYVPEMAYNQVDVTVGTTVLGAGGQVGTRIGSDGAFSAKTSLRLTIKLGPREIMEPLK